MCKENEKSEFEKEFEKLMEEMFEMRIHEIFDYGKVYREDLGCPIKLNEASLKEVRERVRKSLL